MKSNREIAYSILRHTEDGRLKWYGEKNHKVTLFHTNIMHTEKKFSIIKVYKSIYHPKRITMEVIFYNGSDFLIDRKIHSTRYTDIEKVFNILS